MALIDPCVALPFDAGNGGALRSDERLSADDFDTTPPPPITNADAPPPQSPPPQSTAAAVVAAAAAAVVSPVSSAAAVSAASVFSSVFSYIFKENIIESAPTTPQSRPRPPPPPPALSAPSTPRTAPQLSAHSSPVAPLSPLLPHSSAAADIGRTVLVLDLDETLLHSFFPDKVTADQYAFVVEQCREQERAERDGAISADERTLFLVDVGDGTIVVCMFRPGLRAFIADIFQHFDVGVWSAGGKLYVDAICRVLFPPALTHRPIFQLCWDDVQADYQHSYTKPLTLLTQRFPSIQLPQLLLIDNRRENGVHFPTQFLLATDYLPKPWEWTPLQADMDEWLIVTAMPAIQARVKEIQSSFAHQRHHHSAHRHHHHNVQRIAFSGLSHHQHQQHHPLHHGHIHSLLHSHRSTKRRVNLLAFTDTTDVLYGLDDDDDDTDFDRELDTEAEHNDVRALEDAETEREDDDFDVDVDDENAFMMDVDIPADSIDDSAPMNVQRFSDSHFAL